MKNYLNIICILGFLSCLLPLKGYSQKRDIERDIEWALNYGPDSYGIFRKNIKTKLEYGDLQETYNITITALTNLGHNNLKNVQFVPALNPTNCKFFNELTGEMEPVNWCDGCKDGYVYGSRAIIRGAENGTYKIYSGTIVKGKMQGIGRYRGRVGSDGFEVGGEWIDGYIEGNGYFKWLGHPFQDKIRAMYSNNFTKSWPYGEMIALDDKGKPCGKCYWQGKKFEKCVYEIDNKWLGFAVVGILYVAGGIELLKAGIKASDYDYGGKNLIDSPGSEPCPGACRKEVSFYFSADAFLEGKRFLSVSAPDGTEFVTDDVNWYDNNRDHGMTDAGTVYARRNECVAGKYHFTYQWHLDERTPKSVSGEFYINGTCNYYYIHVSEGGYAYVSSSRH